MIENDSAIQQVIFDTLNANFNNQMTVEVSVKPAPKDIYDDNDAATARWFSPVI
ncbi:MAG: hypothetical protein R2856_25950 [Caldilineaceae bacterium]